MVAKAAEQYNKNIFIQLITNSLMYISKTIYESITINKVLLIRMSSKIIAIKMSDSKTVNVLKYEYIHLGKLKIKTIKNIQQNRLL